MRVTLRTRWLSLGQVRSLWFISTYCFYTPYTLHLKQSIILKLLKAKAKSSEKLAEELLGKFFLAFMKTWIFLSEPKLFGTPSTLTVMIASESRPKSNRFPLDSELEAEAESVKNLAILALTLAGKRPPCKSNSCSVLNACFNSSFVRRGCDLQEAVQNSKKRLHKGYFIFSLLFKWSSQSSTILPSRRSKEN